jgi:hypothetical protein
MTNELLLLLAATNVGWCKYAQLFFLLNNVLIHSQKLLVQNSVLGSSWTNSLIQQVFIFYVFFIYVTCYGYILARHRGMRLECASINLSRTHVLQFLGTTSHLLACHVHWTPNVNPSVGSIHMIKFQPTITQMTFVEVTY